MSLRRAAVPFLCCWQRFNVFCRSISTHANLNRPLNLFVCAADEASDRAGAALVGALRQLHQKPLHIYGVGGSLLQAQGLQSIVTEEQYGQLATAEVVQPAGGLHKLWGLKAKAAYQKIFSEAIYEPAIDGCRGSILQQQQQPIVPIQQNQTHMAGSSMPAKVPEGLTFDAVLTIGSPVASQQLLFFLRKAEEAKKARLPVMVQYMVNGLWDFQQLPSTTRTWAKLADHVMCTLPFEPALLQAAGCPASFVGHPLVEQQLLQHQSFGSRQRRLLQMLQQKATATAAGGSARCSGSAAVSGAGSPVFAAADPAVFWRFFDNIHGPQGQEGLEGAATEGSATVSSSSSSSNVVSTVSQRPRKLGNRSSSSSSSSKTRPESNNKISRRPLLLLLSGTTEAEVASCMPVFDSITRALLSRETNLAAAMVVPDLLVDEACLATNNFALPLVVLPVSSSLCSNAAAAAAAALSHPGSASLQAVVAGLPLVCVRPGATKLLDSLRSLRAQDHLPFSCVPNLVMSHAVVPEFKLFERGAEEAATEALADLLAGAGAGAGGGGGASAANAPSSKTAPLPAAGPAVQPPDGAWEAQRAVLQELLLELLPPLQQQQQATVQHGQVVQLQTAVVGSNTEIKASEAAARMLLELMRLRKQQEAVQLWQYLEARGSTAGVKGE